VRASLDRRAVEAGLFRRARVTLDHPSAPAPAGGTMYVLILLLVPFLFLFNSYLAMGALIAAIVFMYVQRTRPAKRRDRASAREPAYKAGYEN
jgi:hypothetical protein